MGWSNTMLEIREVPGSSPAWERFFQPYCYPPSTGNLWPDARGTWMELMGSVRAPRGTQGLILFATAGNEVTKTPSFEAFGIGEFIEFRYGSRPF